MAYVIAEPCMGVKDTACVDACPVDCIHPKRDESDFAQSSGMYRLWSMRSNVPGQRDLC